MIEEPLPSDNDRTKQAITEHKQTVKWDYSGTVYRVERHGHRTGDRWRTLYFGNNYEKALDQFIKIREKMRQGAVQLAMIACDPAIAADEALLTDKEVRHRLISEGKFFVLAMSYAPRVRTRW